MAGPTCNRTLFLLRAGRVGRRFDSVNGALLPDDLRPDALVTDAEAQRDGVTMTQEDFYGRLLLHRGEAPRYLGQPTGARWA